MRQPRSVISIRRAGLALTAVGCLLLTGALGGPTLGASAQLSLTVPASAAQDVATSVRLRLPGNVAAVDGRAYFDSGALEFIGVAPVRGGTVFAPVDIAGGVAFGAYDLRPKGRNAVLDLIVVPHRSGQIELRIMLDSVAARGGARLGLARSAADATLYAGAGATYSAPGSSWHPTPLRAAGAPRTLVGLRTLVGQDLDAVRAAWTDSRLNGAVCGAAIAAQDANGDGCVDAVDVQAVAAGIGQPAGLNPQVEMVAPTVDAASLSPTGVSGTNQLGAAVAYSKTFTVTYAGDTADAHPGDGQCADGNGRCSLRAAMTEANWSHGPDFIGFNINATAPVVISIGSVLPFLNDTSGGTTIDAYTQPGSKVNTAQYGSNAVPGIAISGTGNDPRTNIFHITSSGNVIRGFALYKAYRIIAVGGTGATGNSIVGNWFGILRTGSAASFTATEDIYFDQGPSNNVVGTPALADRNVFGNATKGIDFYGPGTNNNVVQNNVFCMTPSGAASLCSTGVDHDFGPKGTQIGGFGTNQRNVFGPTRLNGIEISHGWDPDGKDTSTKWRNMNIHVEGNWIGFRMDGSYNAAYRSAQNTPSSNDGNAVNIYDGCSDNVIDGNYLASAFDGVNTMVSNCFSNTIRNNIIGESPKGQAAPMAWWGVHVRQGTYDTVISGNVIRNATMGGIGLTTGNERRIRISHNIVSDTSGPAIHLEPAGGSSAPGSNVLYARPVISSATTSNAAGTGIAGATVEVYRASRNAGQSGLPVEYLGSATVKSNGTWSVPITVAQGARISAIQIAPNGNTSELGTNVTAGQGSVQTAPVADFSWSQQSGTRTVSFTDTSTNGPTSWSWVFGDGGTSSQRNPAHTYSSAGSYSVKLTVGNGAGSDSQTRSIIVSDAPSNDTTYVADSFSRTKTNKWGRADVGGAYTVLVKRRNYDVANGVGTIKVPKGGALRSALLNGVNARDVDVTFKVAANKAPAGDAYWVYAVVRRNGGNEYRTKIRIQANGSVGVHASRVLSNNESPLGSEVAVPGLKLNANSFIWVRSQVIGSGPTTLRVKAWAAGQAEPPGWQYSQTDNTSQLQGSGSAGLRVYLGPKVSVAPVLFSIDDYSIEEPQ